MSESLPPSVKGQTAETVAASIEDSVRDGILPPGTRLPTVRALAEGLSISPGTAAAAYRSLQSRGVIVSQGRRGTSVGFRPMHRSRCSAALPDGVIDLSTGNPDPKLLPSPKRLLAKIDLSPRLYGQPKEDPTLLKAIVRRFAACGVQSGEICVINGAIDAIERVLAENLRCCDRVAVEDPGFGNVYEMVVSRGFVPVPVGVDEEGIVPEQLAKACVEGVKALIVTPRVHNPTGASLSEGRARMLRAVLRNYPDVLLIEDDHAAWITEAPLYCLHTAKRKSWVYVRSFSKALNPDLRMAVLTGDQETITRVQDRLIVGERWVSHILQRLAAAMITDVAVRKHFKFAIAEYRKRRQAFLSALADRGISAVGPFGWNVWVPVPEEAPVIQTLLAAGWAVAAGERFRINSPPAVRISTSTLLPPAARRLAADLARALSPASRTSSV